MTTPTPIGSETLVERLRKPPGPEYVAQGPAILIKLCREAASRIEELEGEVDEAISWSWVVDRHGMDGFDDLAEKWLAQEGIRRMHNAVASVFSKWANDELLERFKGQMRATMHQSFVEGCLVGVRAEAVGSEAALQSLQRQLEEAREALREAKRAMWATAHQDWNLADFKNWAVIQQIDAALAASTLGRVENIDNSSVSGIATALHGAPSGSEPAAQGEDQ